MSGDSKARSESKAWAWLISAGAAAALTGVLVVALTGSGETASTTSPSAATTTGSGTEPTPATAPEGAATVSCASGSAFFVAAEEPGASDRNNGRYPTHRGGQDGPWLTVRHAAEVMGPGDVTCVRAGVYIEAGITFGTTGVPGSPITLAGYPGEEAILDGTGVTDLLPGIWIDSGKGYLVIEGLTIRNMPWSGIGSDPQTSAPYPGLVIRDCDLYGNGWSGIDLAAAEGFLVEGVQAHDNAFYGLNIGASEDGLLPSTDGEVRDSAFYDHTGEEGHGLAINQGHDITLSGIETYGNRIHGVDISDMPKAGDLSYGIVVEGCSSHDNGVAGFSINSDSHHVVFRRNRAWQNETGFLCYEGCWHVEWYHNVAVGNSDAGFRVQADLGLYGTPGDSLLVFKNNIAQGNGLPGSYERPGLVVEGDGWQAVIEHNDWSGGTDGDDLVVGLNVVGDAGDIYRASEVAQGLAGGNLSVDPGFVDAAAGDWRLSDDSPLIDRGVDVGLSFCGTAPDLGAFEHCP